MLHTINSREIAEMASMDHKTLLRDIRGYMELLHKDKGQSYSPKDFFIESTDPHVRETFYNITLAGCHFIASRMKFTSKRAILFSAKYSKKFARIGA